MLDIGSELSCSHVKKSIYYNMKKLFCNLFLFPFFKTCHFWNPTESEPFSYCRIVSEVAHVTKSHNFSVDFHNFLSNSKNQNFLFWFLDTLFLRDILKPTYEWVISHRPFNLVAVAVILSPTVSPKNSLATVNSNLYIHPHCRIFPRFVYNNTNCKATRKTSQWHTKSKKHGFYRAFCLSFCSYSWKFLLFMRR